MTKRLLIVSRHFWPEDTKLNSLCMELVKKGCRIDVLCGQPSDENGKFMAGYSHMKIKREIHDKLDIRRTFDISRGSRSNVNIFMNYMIFPIMGMFQAKKLSQNKYDAVLVYQTSPVMMAWPALKVGKIKKIPVYVYINELWPQSLYQVLDVQSSLFKKIVDRMSMSVYRRADKLLVPSARMQKYLMDRLVIPKEQVPVVPVPPDHYYEIEEKDEILLEQLAGSFNIVIIGDFKEQISVDSVLQIARRIRKNNYKNIRFVVLGTGEKIAEMKMKADEQSLHDYFYFEGKVESNELGKYLYITDILLAAIRPSDEHAAYAQMINYMAAGKPIVVTMLGMVKELLKKAECGFASEPDDISSLYNNIIRLYKMSPSERAAMGENGRRYQMQHNSRKINADIIFEIISGSMPSEPSKEVSEIRSLWEDIS